MTMREEAQMPQTVASILVGVLEQVGVKHIFGLIGDSLNPLADAPLRPRRRPSFIRRRRPASSTARSTRCSRISTWKRSGTTRWQRSGKRCSQ